MIKFIKKFKIPLIIIICLLLLGSGIVYATSNNTINPLNEKTYSVRKETLQEKLTLSGTIEADEKAVLRFASSGRIAWIGVKEGDSVKKFQTLASLDQRELKKNLEKKLNSYLDTRWSFDQSKDTNTDTTTMGSTERIRTAAQRILDQSQFGLNNAVLDVELESLTLEYASLWTPIEGIVTRIDTPQAGVNITPASAEFEVVNPTTLYLSVLPDQTEVSKLTSSMSAEIIFDSYPETTVSGTITSIAFAPKQGESSTVYEVKLAFPLLEQNYRLGMTADATFVVKEKVNALSIPLSFLKNENGKQYVFRKTGNTKTKTQVTTGFESDENIEITSGLSEGDILYD